MNEITVFTAKTFGYTDNTGGYSRWFSWFRLPHSPLFSVYGHIENFTSIHNRAITDDFGNLVAVSA